MTDDSQDPPALKVLKGLYEAFESGNLEAAMALVDPDIVITYPPSMPMAGEWRGHQGLADLFAAVGALWQDRTTVVHGYVAQGEMVVVLVTTEGKVHGRHLVMPIAETYRVRDGRIVEGKPFFWDTQAVHAAVSASAA